MPLDSIPYRTADRARESAVSQHILIKRAVAKFRRHYATASRDRLTICENILRRNEDKIEFSILVDAAMAVPETERYYWVSALYMLLMPRSRRRRLSAYFTPPHLCEHILNRLEAHGVEIGRDRVLDPASGGAAFLVPWASRLLAKARNSGWSPMMTLANARRQLSGIEIEPGSAALSETLLADVFARELASTGSRRMGVIERRNALKSSPPTIPYDVVISNPPYSRVFRPSETLKERWKCVISESHVNTYALFIAASLEQVRPGGLAALVIPTSFISGPYFKKLRSHILSLSVPLELHLVEKRSDVFLDVVQDTCVLLLRKRLTDQEIAPPPNCSIVQTDGVVVSLGIVDVPLSGDRAWALPHSGNRGGCDDPFNARFSRLADYGYSAKAGYFVWNRSMDRLSDRTVPLAGEVPLVWAHNVQAGKVVEMGARSDPSLTTFVRVPADSSAMLTGETIVLQRTTNRAQQRRLVAGLVSEQAAQRYGGFVSENHTIVIVRSKDRSQLVEPRELMALLNSQPVDEMFRRFSGTVSVSTRLLRDLPLPHPTMLPGSLADSVDIDNAIAEAYLSSSAIGLEPPDPPPPSAENLPAS